LGHALSSFQRSLPLSANPNLDVWDSFRLPQATIYRLKETVTLTQAGLIVKRCPSARRFRPYRSAATKQPLSLSKAFEREAARQTRSLYLAVNRLVSGKEAL
jgi:hypothetical protein